MVNNHFQKINNVEGDGYFIVSALAYFIPNDRRLVDDFWKYIEFGLKRVNQEEVFRATISCICDFATIYRESISDKVDPIFNELLDVFEVNFILLRRTSSQDNLRLMYSCASERCSYSVEKSVSGILRESWTSFCFLVRE